MNYEIIAESNESTVIAEYHSDNEKKALMRVKQS